MQGRNYQPHPIALANVGRGIEVSAYEQRNAHGSRTQRRDSQLQARAHHVRACARPRPLDDGTAEWGSDDNYRAEVAGSVAVGVALVLWATFFYCMFGLL